jgi:hypothetical protein
MLSPNAAADMLDAVLHQHGQGPTSLCMSIEKPSAEDWQCKHEPLPGLCNSADSPFLHLPQPGNAFVTLRNDSMAVMVAEKFIKAGDEVSIEQFQLQSECRQLSALTPGRDCWNGRLRGRCLSPLLMLLRSPCCPPIA